MSIGSSFTKSIIECPSQSSFGSSFQKEIFQSGQNINNSPIRKNGQNLQSNQLNSSNPQEVHQSKNQRVFQLFSLLCVSQQQRQISAISKTKEDQLIKSFDTGQRVLSQDFLNSSGQSFQKEIIKEIQMKSNQIYKIKQEQEIYQENKKKGADHNRMIDDDSKKEIQGNYQDMDIYKKLDDSAQLNFESYPNKQRQTSDLQNSFEVKQYEFHIEIAQTQKKQYHFSSSIEYFEKAIQQLKQKNQTNTLDYLKSFIGLTSTYNKAQQHQKTIEYCQKVKQILQKLKQNNPDQELQKFYCDIYLFHGTALSFTGKYQQAGSQLKKALEYTIKYYTEDSLETQNAYIEMALYYQEFNQLSKAIQYYKKSLQITKKIQSAQTATIDQVRPLINLAGCQCESHNFEEALNSYKKAQIYLQEAFQTKHYAYAAVLYGIGLVYANTNHLKEGLEKYLQAKAIYQENESVNSFQFSGLKGNIAVCYRWMGQYEQASKQLEQTKKEFQQMDCTMTIEYPYFLTNIASIRIRKNLLQQAQISLKQARQIINENNHKQLESNDLQNFLLLHTEGLLQMKKENYQESFRLFNKAEEMFNSIPNSRKEDSPFYLQFAQDKQELDEVTGNQEYQHNYSYKTDQSQSLQSGMESKNLQNNHK